MRKQPRGTSCRVRRFTANCHQAGVDGRGDHHVAEAVPGVEPERQECDGSVVCHLNRSSGLERSRRTGRPGRVDLD